jgi:hypothetical protein
MSKAKQASPGAALRVLWGTSCGATMGDLSGFGYKLVGESHSVRRHVRVNGAWILAFGDPYADGRSAHNESHRTARAGGTAAVRRARTDGGFGSVSPCRTPSRPPTG